MAIPGNFRVRDKQAEKISKYQDLALEISRMWKTRTRMIPIVIGALGAVSLLTEYLALMEEIMTRKGDCMQKTAVLGSAHISFFEESSVYPSPVVLLGRWQKYTEYTESCCNPQ